MKGYSPRWDNRSLEERFHAKIDKSKGCWLWQGSVALSGYGRITFEGKTYRAHRLSWILHRGDIPEGLVVCHSCDTPSCVNPNHLWIGTNADNIADRDAKKRTAKGSEISNSNKLTEEEVLSIRRLHADEALSWKELSRRFKVSDVQVRNIVLRKSWKHI